MHSLLRCTDALRVLLMTFTCVLKCLMFHVAVVTGQMIAKSSLCSAYSFL